MGLDSTAILLRWLTEPESRDFSLEEMVVITSMTGDEWPETGQMVSELILPLFRAHRIRYIQVARAGPKQADGVRVLDDSRTPERLFLEGDYALSQEMLRAGTVPQYGGARRCSAKAKGWPLDQVIGQITEGRPYRHVVGFEANEANRAVRDSGFNTAHRTGVYPLIEWGWDREMCEAYVLQTLGVLFPKSACTYCPFALVTAQGRARTLERFASDPDSGVAALFMEHIAAALNPRQSLAPEIRLYDILAASPDHDQVLALLENRFDKERWAVYEVRRALLPSARHPDRPGTSARQVRVVAAGSRPAMEHALAAVAIGRSQAVDDSDPRHPRVWLRRREPHLPTTEEFFTISPHTVPDKIGPGFATAWAKATSQPDPSIVISVSPELYASLEYVLGIIGIDINAAGVQAIEEWIAKQMSDPTVWANAQADLDDAESRLRARRQALENLINGETRLRA
jgi:hypothetical protein